MVFLTSIQDAEPPIGQSGGDTRTGVHEPASTPTDSAAPPRGGPGPPASERDRPHRPSGRTDRRDDDHSPDSWLLPPSYPAFSFRRCADVAASSLLRRAVMRILYRPLARPRQSPRASLAQSDLASARRASLTSGICTEFAGPFYSAVLPGVRPRKVDGKPRSWVRRDASFCLNPCPSTTEAASATAHRRPRNCR